MEGQGIQGLETDKCHKSTADGLQQGRKHRRDTLLKTALVGKVWPVVEITT